MAAIKLECMADSTSGYPAGFVGICKVGSVQHYDNKLLQFLLKAHRPDLYGEKKQSALPPLPFDLGKRLAAARPRLEAHMAERRAMEAMEDKERAEKQKLGREKGGLDE